MTTYTAAYRVEVRTTSGRPVLTVDKTTNGKPLDQAYADSLADILRGAHGDHEVVVSQAPLTQLQAWRALADLVEETGFAPGDIQVATYQQIRIHLPRNERAQVDTWFLRLGLFDRDARSVMWPTISQPSYGHALYQTSGESALLPGWSVDVYCGIDTNGPASAHGKGLESPDPDEYKAWKAARTPAAAELGEPVGAAA